MNGWKRNVLAILVLLVLFGFSAVNIANAVEAVIVSDVLGLADYVSRANSFSRGSTLEVYTEMSDVNYDGFAFVDFFYIIEDPQGNVVSMDQMDVNYRGYDSDMYGVYTKTIPFWWKYGEYKLTVYAYNVLNKKKIYELQRELESSTQSREKVFDDENKFEDMEDLFNSACGGDRDDLDNIGVIKSIPDSLREITSIRFFVRPEEEITEEELPPEFPVIKGTKFTVTNMRIDKFTVKPDEPVLISVTVKNEGTRGTEEITLVINEEKEAEESVTLDSLASTTLQFTVKKSLPGQYKVTILGTDIVKQFFVEESSGEEETGNSTSFLSASKMSEAGASSGSCFPVHVFGFVPVAIFVFVIMSLCFRPNKQARTLT